MTFTALGFTFLFWRMGCFQGQIRSREVEPFVQEKWTPWLRKKTQAWSPSPSHVSSGSSGWGWEAWRRDLSIPGCEGGRVHCPVQRMPRVGCPQGWAGWMALLPPLHTRPPPLLLSTVVFCLLECHCLLSPQLPPLWLPSPVPGI